MVNEILDMDELMDRVLDDWDLIVELIGDFIKDFQDKRKTLHKAVEHKEFEQIQETAHKIKGAAGNISVKPMFNCCMLIEQLAKEKNMDLVKELLQDLDNQFAELKAYSQGLKKKK